MFDQYDKCEERGVFKLLIYNYEEIINWIDELLQKPLIKCQNLFAKLSISDKNFSSPPIIHLTDKEYSNICSQFTRFRSTEPIGADRLLEWTKSFLVNVATSDNPTVSLHDLIRVKLATVFNDKNAISDGMVQIVVGDLSGIQNYLFAIAHVGENGVAKRLRARSFYLSCLAKTAAFYIADSFHLSYRHILMTTGGLFMMILPSKSNLKPVQQEMERHLYTEFHGYLQIHLACKQIKINSLDQISSELSVLHASIHQSKNRPFSSLFQDQEKWTSSLWLHNHHGQKYCVSCRRNPVVQKNSTDEERLCLSCKRDEVLGRKLPKSNYALYSKVGKYQLNESDTTILLWNKYKLRLLEEINQPLELRKDEQYVCIESWNGITEQKIEEVYTYSANWHESVHISNHVPNKNGQTLTFVEIADTSEGQPLLSIYKADVDRLGLLLSYGLRQNNNDYSLVEYIGVSRQLESFFAGKLTVELKEKFPDLYTVFTGGDDLFIIGPWSQIPQFASWLREEFDRFVEGNEQVTLSAAITVTSAKTAVATAANAIETELDKAKEEVNWLRRITGHNLEGRNQVSLCGTIMEWSDLRWVWSQVQRWKRWSDKKVCSSGFFRRLLELSELHQRFHIEGDINGLKYHAFLEYEKNRQPFYTKQEKNEDEQDIASWINGLLKIPDEEAARQWSLIPVIYRLYLYIKE